MTTIKIQRDLRGVFGPVRDQGSRQTCLAIAMSDMHSAVIGEAEMQLSCEYLFYRAKQRDGLSLDSGTTVSAVQAALEEDGQPREHDWPYLATLPADPNAWEPPATIGPLFYKRSQLITPSTVAILETIENGSPVLIGLSLSPAFFDPGSDGVIDVDEPVLPDLRHAVVAVAVGSLKGEYYIMVRNSWGTTWGDGGYAWTSERYLRNRILVALKLV